MPFIKRGVGPLIVPGSSQNLPAVSSGLHLFLLPKSNYGTGGNQSKRKTYTSSAPSTLHRFCI
jgi:hypothetical protein